MRALLGSLLLATACLAGAGCASKPAEETHAAARDTASIDQACANAAGNSLHLTSTSSSSVVQRDPAIDAVLSQPTSDPRLAQINRRMYQSLRSLDAELRREQMLAACEQQPTLQAQASNQSGVAPGSAGGAAEVAPAVTSVAPTSVPVASSAVAAVGTTRALRKTSLSSTVGGGGNGATAPKVVPGSDNDVVARRLRKAAEQETDPGLRAKLWKEYTDYRQGSSAK